MADVRQTPFNEIPEKWAFDPDLEPFIQSLLNQINELRIRVGGDTDVVASSDAAAATNFYAAGIVSEPNNGFALFDKAKEKEYSGYNLFTQLFEGDPLKGEKSTVNSTTTPLTGGATFTGTGELNDWPQGFVSVKTDAGGTLYVDFSTDQGSPTNWDSTLTYTVTDGINEFQPFVKGARWIRVRLTNGSSAQSYLRLGLFFGENFTPASSPLNLPYSLDSAATLVRPTTPWLDVSRGKATGIRSIKKFGRNDSVGTSFVPVCMGGVYQTPQSGSATTLRVKAGGNANDTAAGSGARSITLEGLDQNFELVTESLATAGASASSATTATFTRIFRAYITPDTGSGTYATSLSGSHAGDIVIENGSGGTDWVTIDSSDFPKSQSEIGAYSVPTGKTAYVKLNNVTASTGKEVDVIFFWRANADETSAPYSAMRTQSVLTGIDGGVIDTYGDLEVPYGPYVGPCDIGFMAKVSATTGSVAIEFEIIEVDE